MGEAVENLFEECIWPVDFIPMEKVRESGLFYFGDGSNDILECLVCGVKLSDWEEGDDPLEVHREAFPDCDFLKRLAGVKRDKNDNGDSVPYNKYLTTVEERQKTFEDWPESIRVSSYKMADAGLYYSGTGDKVTCFYCGGELNGWSEEDDPWEVHAYWFPACRYVILVQDRPAKNVDDEAPKKLLSDVLAEECSICRTTLKDTCLVPCGHIETCKPCTSTINTCPECYAYIADSVKVNIVNSNNNKNTSELIDFD